MPIKPTSETFSVHVYQVIAALFKKSFNNTFFIDLANPFDKENHR
ncbi:hypothetical protein VCHA54P486_230045 [Vibrio chagasii]|nr:hypothetical protein VCHA54P486_230045 [Vibrio chagasii]